VLGITRGQGQFWELLGDHLGYGRPFNLALGDDLKPINLRPCARTRSGSTSEESAPRAKADSMKFQRGSTVIGVAITPENPVVTLPLEGGGPAPKIDTLHHAGRGF